MYQVSDLFFLFQYHCDYIVHSYLYVILQFLLMYVLFFLSKNGVLEEFSSVVFPGFFRRNYALLMLVLMMLISVILAVCCIVLSNVVFNMSNDFVYLAGVVLGFRKGIVILLIGCFYRILMLCLELEGVMWMLYMFLDLVFYFSAGLFFSTMLYTRLENISASEILFICLNKITVSMVSATLWFFMMGDAWFSGFNVLLFRLVAWPMVTIPMMTVFLFLLRTGVRQSLQQTLHAT
ncbi:hypothetical protein [Aquitalea pelogenes]|uniref:hypothetical protein n=1 Tax=Aquitalea pelogenes TaxID=1293573 RepID=UPI0035AEF744